MKDRLGSIVRRSGKYVSVTALGTVIETLVLWWCTEFLFATFETRYVVAPIISFECAVINNFLLSYLWIWKESVGNTLHDMIVRFAAYNFATFLVFVVRLGLLAGIGSIAGWHPVFCNLIALMTTGILNFSIQHEIIFRPDFLPGKFALTVAMPRTRDERKRRSLIDQF